MLWFSTNHYSHVTSPGSADSHEEELFPEYAETRTGAVREATRQFINVNFQSSQQNAQQRSLMGFMLLACSSKVFHRNVWDS